MIFKLEFTQEEVQVIAAGLGELPFKMSNILFAKIQTEVVKQENAAGKRMPVKEK